ncbi:metalloregulator ArsR/SmtB family transcription factor [Paenibacillus campinasensis]|uniref:Metalloregulator ArsR/SmtB family transcription factor n=1 Tax=Paenibacillus campinasensis TaxID=66347 RepID=A0ABW9T7Z6_9BACL|nr:metalloregulator ArsR/SmtB family transcription factor [Paenibacillus campinasensis]
MMDRIDRKKQLSELAKAFSECQQALTAIGDPTRQLMILALMEDRGECKQGIRVGEITSKINLSRPAVSHHLKVLREANFIGMNREGTKNYYYLEVLQNDIFKLKRLIDKVAEYVHQLQEDRAPGSKEEEAKQVNKEGELNLGALCTE